MAVLQSPTNPSALAEVDLSFKAMRATLRPAEAAGWFSVGVTSGAITGIAAAAAVFSLRNISSNPILIRRVGVGFIATTGFTAAQQLGWALKVARAFTVSDSVGTAVDLTGNNAKLRTTHASLSSVDCRISATAALTAGTKVLDVTNLGVVGTFAPAAGLGSLLPISDRNLLAHDAGDHPLVLGQNEGINIQNVIAMGAAGVGTLYVNLEIAEALSF